MGFQYVKSVSGMLKIAAELFNLIAFAILLSAFVSDRGDAFLVASIGGFIITAVLIILHVLDVITKTELPIAKIECIFCVVWGVFYLITSALVVDVVHDKYRAAGSFGLFATLMYLVDAYNNYSRF